MHSKSCLQTFTNKLEDESPIVAKFRDHEIRREDVFPYGKYVLYKIEFSSNIKNWSVSKRYNNFMELHLEMSKVMQKHYMPLFPKKTIFNMSPVTISERKVLLEVYINFMLKIQRLINNSSILLDFIELQPEDLMMILNNSDLQDPVASYTKSFVAKATISPEVNIIEGK